MDTNVNDKLIHAIDDLGHTIDDVVTFYHLHGDQMNDPAQNMVIGLIELLNIMLAHSRYFSGESSKQ